MNNSAYFVKSTPPRVCRYITDILKTCMKKFNGKKIDKFTAFFDLANF